MKNSRKNKNTVFEDAMLSTILCTSPSGVVTTDENGKITYLNKKAEEILGLTRTSKDSHDIITNQDNTGYSGSSFPGEEILEKVKEYGNSLHEIHHILEWPDNTRTFLVINACLLPEKDNKAEGLLAFIEDVTEEMTKAKGGKSGKVNLQSAEQFKDYEALNEELRQTNLSLFAAKEIAEENEKRFRILAENIPGTIYLCNNDEDYSMLYLNDKVEELTGYPKEDFISKKINFPDLYHPDDLNHVFNAVDKSLETKEQFHIIYRLKHKSGKYLWMEEYGIGVYKNDELTFLEGFIIDISDRINQEKELILAKERAEESDKLKTKFLHNMSHEIRTPMNGIIGFSEMLNDPDLSDEKRKYYSRIVQNSSHQLLKFIEDILEISTLETKKIDAREDRVVLNELLNELFSDYILKSKEHNIPLYLKKQLNDSESQIVSDKFRINKILRNLIENAIKYTTEGHIELGYYVDKDHLHIYVEDTGMGIAPEKQKIIFERFAREDQELSVRHSGLGLGLSIAKENAVILGGHISLISEKRKGSTFTLTIPFRPFKDPAKERNTGILRNTKEKKRSTILIAEDEEVNYLYLETLFANHTDHTFDLYHAKNGQEAVDLCSKIPNIDLVLMDIKMPIMNGFDSTRKIKAMFPDLPVIAQTAYTTESDKKMAMENGCVDFLTKPTDREKLFRIIYKHLDLSKRNI